MGVFPLPHEVEALLPELGVDSASISRVGTIAGGLSGGRLYRLWLRDTNGREREHTRVVKYCEPLEGWLGDTSGDSHVREAQLAASGIVADLPPGIVTPTMAVAFRGPRARPQAAALLMRDLLPYLLRQPFRVPPGRLPVEALAIIDRLAHMHARYWSDPRLDDALLGLMTPERALLVTGPRGVAARLAAGDTLPYLAVADAGWRDFFALAGDAASQRLQAIMAEPEPLARVINRLPRTLAHGDVWGPNLGWLPPNGGKRRLVLLDWALALAGPATYDPLWLCSTWFSVDPTVVLAAYRAALNRRLLARGYRIDDTTWLALADAGYLRTVLTCGEALARTALSVPAGRARQRALTRVHWWIARALRAADRLEHVG